MTLEDYKSNSNRPFKHIRDLIPFKAKLSENPILDPLYKQNADFPIKDVTRGKTYTILSIDGCGYKTCTFGFIDDSNAFQMLDDYLFEEP